MFDGTIIASVKKYAAALARRRIHPKHIVLYGSHARGEAGEWSDIDLLVIAPEFDLHRTPQMEDELWRAIEDPRIEPIACGVEEWESGDTGRFIVEIARDEGIYLTL